MKTESTAKFVIRLAITLLLITGVVAAALAAVNSVTEPAIAQLTEQKTQEAIAAVLKGGYDSEIADFDDQGGLVTRVYAGSNGYAFEVIPGGFDNTITMMVGVDNEDNVAGISVISHTETAGLGAVAAATTSDGEAFRGQFVGMNGTVTVFKDGGQVEAITGATITSRAVCTGVNAALACAETLG